MVQKAQNHMHMSMTLGGAPENAPDMKWTAMDRLPTPQVFMSIRRAQSGKLQRHILTSDGTTPVLLTDYKYVVKVEATATRTLHERLDDFLSMLGQRVYLVDNDHCDNGEDHTPFVKNMIFANLESLPHFNRDLVRYDVTIELMDDSL